jgi:hypothetical protein
MTVSTKSILDKIRTLLAGVCPLLTMFGRNSNRVRNLWDERAGFVELKATPNRVYAPYENLIPELTKAAS